MGTTVFSAVATFILFREALEAAVVVSMLLAITGRMGLKKLRRQVWYGALTGVLFSLILGVVAIVLFYVARNKIFKGKSQYIFNGWMSVVAYVMITILAFAMLKFMGYEEKWQRKLEAAADNAKGDLETKRNNWAVFLLAWSIVFREGVETVIFLAGVSGSVPPSSLPLSGFVGIVAGLAVGMFIFYCGKTVKDLKWFFIISAVLLWFIAAGLVSNGLRMWSQVGWFGEWSYACTDRIFCSWSNLQVWNTEVCCPSYDDGTSKGKFFALVSAVFGYQSNPTRLSTIGYFTYWGVVLAITTIKYVRGSLNDANAKHKRRLAKQQNGGVELTSPADGDIEAMKVPMPGHDFESTTIPTPAAHVDFDYQKASNL